MGTTPSDGWNHRPDLPIANSPLFAWPPRPAGWWRWLRATWLSLATTPLWAALGSAIWYLVLPNLADMRELTIGWVARAWLINLVLMTVVAGGLHYVLYTRSRQENRLKFDRRGMARGAPFTFGHQVRDNMFWTLSSGVTFWTAYQVGCLWLLANGHLPVANWTDDLVWFVLFFLIIPIWTSMHFYFVHRALHWKPLYRLAHALHHRNTSPGPWSGISMHPVEHLFYFSSVLIHLVLPTHPVHVVFHLHVMALNPPCSHSGYQELEASPGTPLGDFFHQLHHRYFDCNYGTAEMPWDRWFGSFHDGTESATRRLRERQRRMTRPAGAGAR